MVMMEWFRRTISNFDYIDNSQKNEEHVLFNLVSKVELYANPQ
jgi:hypothetical protein